MRVVPLAVTVLLFLTLEDFWKGKAVSLSTHVFQMKSPALIACDGGLPWFNLWGFISGRSKS